MTLGSGGSSVVGQSLTALFLPYQLCPFAFSSFLSSNSSSWSSDFPLPRLAVDLKHSLFASIFAQLLFICLFLGVSVSVLSEESWIVRCSFLPMNL